MKVLIYSVCALSIIYISFTYGKVFEGNRIQVTCEADDGQTIINGTAYVCLSSRQIQILRDQGARRGL